MKNQRQSRVTWVAVVAGLVAFVALLPIPEVWADTITFDLTTPNSGISGFTGPYATVTVTTTATGATITFTSDSSGGNIFLMGDGGSVALNVNGSFTPGTVTGANSGTGFTPGPYSNGGAGNEDGFGSFNLTVNSFDGFTHSSDIITVTLTGSWASASDVLTANSAGAFAAAHIFVTSSPADASNGALATGYAANGGATEVPEPSTLLLAGSGLVSLGYAARRRLFKRLPA